MYYIFAVMQYDVKRNTGKKGHCHEKVKTQLLMHSDSQDFKHLGWPDFSLSPVGPLLSIETESLHVR
jgi:hypothetical protein